MIIDGGTPFLPLFKADAATRTIWARAAVEEPDKAREIMDYVTAKPQFEAWSQKFSDATLGKSLGNIRAMHNPKHLAGKVQEMNFDDANKSVQICIKVLDPIDWLKVEEGGYTGVSIGGGYLKKWKDGELTRYTPRIAEISLVDSPCIPGATFLEMQKSDGSIEEILLKGNPHTFAELLPPPTFAELHKATLPAVIPRIFREDGPLIEGHLAGQHETFGHHAEGTESGTYRSGHKTFTRQNEPEKVRPSIGYTMTSGKMISREVDPGTAHSYTSRGKTFTSHSTAGSFLKKADDAAQREKIALTMREHKEGKLRSWRGVNPSTGKPRRGPKVTDRKQAIAIALSQASRLGKAEPLGKIGFHPLTAVKEGTVAGVTGGGNLGYGFWHGLLANKPAATPTPDTTKKPKRQMAMPAHMQKIVGVLGALGGGYLGARLGARQGLKVGAQAIRQGSGDLTTLPTYAGAGAAAGSVAGAVTGGVLAHKLLGRKKPNAELAKPAHMQKTDQSSDEEFEELWGYPRPGKAKLPAKLTHKATPTPKPTVKVGVEKLEDALRNRLRKSDISATLFGSNKHFVLGPSTTPQEIAQPPTDYQPPTYSGDLSTAMKSEHELFIERLNKAGDDDGYKARQKKRYENKQTTERTGEQHEEINRTAKAGAIIGGGLGAAAGIRHGPVMGLLGAAVGSGIGHGIQVRHRVGKEHEAAAWAKSQLSEKEHEQRIAAVKARWLKEGHHDLDTHHDKLHAVASKSLLGRGNKIAAVAQQRKNAWDSVGDAQKSYDKVRPHLPKHANLMMEVPHAAGLLYNPEGVGEQHFGHDGATKKPLYMLHPAEADDFIMKHGQKAKAVAKMAPFGLISHQRELHQRGTRAAA